VPNSVNNAKLTQKDMMLIGMILVGTTKLVYTRRLVGKYIKRYAKAQSPRKIKSLVRTFVITNLGTITRNKTIFRPSVIREKLPQEWKSIAPADLKRILDYLVKINAITPVRAEHIPVRRKWGPPSKKDVEEREAGRKSFYRISDYYNNLRNVLAKPKAVKLIYSLLFQSGLLYNYLVTTTLLLYYLMKYNDMSVTKNILTTVNASSMIRDLQLKSQANKIKHVNSDKQLKLMAERRARLRIERGRGTDHISLYLQGGLAFSSKAPTTSNAVLLSACIA
jgi:hypothetical protein